MAITNVSLTHKTGPIELLEQVVASVPVGQLLRRLHAEPLLDESMVLSTCNRVEVYARTVDHGGAAAAIVDLLAGQAGLPAGAIREAVVVRDTLQGVEHLLTVACGLDSMAVGEEQIVSQVRHALREAQAARTIGPVLSGLAHAALRTSKRARTETRVGTAGISLAQFGIRMAAQTLGDLAGRTALLLGSGTVATLAGRLLEKEGVGRILVSARRPDRAARLAEAIGGGEVVDPAALPAALAECDIVVAATAAAELVLTADQLRGPRDRAGHRPLFILDLAMPRDVDPDSRGIAGVTLVDLDELGRRLPDGGTLADVAQVRAIVAEETAAYLARRGEASVTPLITKLHAQLRDHVEAELARLYHRLPGLGERERAATAAAMHRVAGRLLHTPTVRAKELSASTGGRVYLEALSQLFDLDAGKVDA
jgi:glutamyl-tRNA reductase